LSKINAPGERCVNAATEEVALALEVLYGVRTGLDLTHLTMLFALAVELGAVPTDDESRGLADELGERSEGQTGRHRPASGAGPTDDRRVLRVVPAKA
jgi:hypothetical protein